MRKKAGSVHGFCHDIPDFIVGTHPYLNPRFLKLTSHVASAPAETPGVVLDTLSPVNLILQPLAVHHKSIYQVGQDKN